MWLPSHALLLPLCTLLICVIVRKERHLSPPRRRQRQRLFFYLLILLELCKQLSALVTNTYHPSLLPLHYSSTFYISIAFYLFGKHRLSHLGACTLYVGGCFLCLTLLWNPYAVLGDPANILRSFLSFHSLFYHFGVLYYAASMLYSGAYQPSRHDSLRILAFILSWACIALPVARLTGNNYAGLLRSYLPPLERFQQIYGDRAYLLLYLILALALATALIQALRQIRTRILTHSFK